MTTVFDVADWFLAKEAMTHKKLQKLCYYAQAWSYAICPEAISDSVFEAWVHGPVCRALYNKYRDYGFGYIPKNNSQPQFSREQTAFLEDVWFTYGNMTANGLEALSHSELPWQKARLGLAADELSCNPIDPSDMRDFYRSIYTGGDA